MFESVSIGGYRCKRLALGAMRLMASNLVRDGRTYECWGPPADPEASRQLVQAAVRELGVDYIDFARGYGTAPGVSEALFRSWLAPYPSDLLWATKVGYERDPDGEWILNLDPGFLDAGVRASVEELGARIPLLYLVVGSTTDVTVRSKGRLADSMAPLLQARERGEVAHLGVANVTAAELTELLELGPIAAVQNKLTVASLGDPAQREVLDLCQRHGIPFVAWGIFQSDGFEPWEPPPELQQAARELGATVQEASIAILLRAAPNLVLLIGASRRATLESSLRAARLEVPPGLLERYGWQ